MVNWWFGGVGGLDFWDPLMKGIVTSWYPDSNPKPPPPNHQFTSECINMSNIIWSIKYVNRHLAVLSLNSIPVTKNKKCCKMQPPHFRSSPPQGFRVSCVKRHKKPYFWPCFCPLRSIQVFFHGHKQGETVWGSWRSVLRPGLDHFKQQVQRQIYTIQKWSEHCNLSFTLLLIAKPCVNVAGCWVQDEKSEQWMFFPAELWLSLTALSSSPTLLSFATKNCGEINGLSSEKNGCQASHAMEMTVRSWV